MDNLIEYGVSGLKCDAKGCDWRDDSVKLEDYEKWLNAPCPQCGANVLTEADMRLTKTLCAAADLVNAAGIGAKVEGPKVKMRLHMDGSGKVVSRELREITE